MSALKKTEVHTKELTKIIKSAKIMIKNIDGIMDNMPQTAERGKAIAKQLNSFEIQLDAFIVFQLRVDLKDIPKITNKNWKL